MKINFSVVRFFRRSNYTNCWSGDMRKEKFYKMARLNGDKWSYLFMEKELVYLSKTLRDHVLHFSLKERILDEKLRLVFADTFVNSYVRKETLRLQKALVEWGQSYDKVPSNSQIKSFIRDNCRLPNEKDLRNAKSVFELDDLQTIFCITNTFCVDEQQLYKEAWGRVITRKYCYGESEIQNTTVHSGI